MVYLMVAAGGALGAVLRFACATWAVARFGTEFPYGTLLVNVVGSAVIGVLAVLVIERAVLSEEWRFLVVVGLLGSFTTFSTFSLETVALIEQGALGRALAYAATSLVTCLAATALALLATRAVLGHPG